jgi:membrane protein DedA with SNARE-associated domain
VIIPIVIGMSHIKPAQYLFYSVISGLIWATTVSTVGYFIGRFFNLQTSVFEENIFVIVLGFACFGVIMGYAMKYFATRNLSQKTEKI